MNIQKNQNISFKANVFLPNPSDSKKLRPVINHFKHHCGDKDVFHEIALVNDCITVASTYIPKGATVHRGSKSIKKIIEWSNETNNWIQSMKPEKIAKKPEKNVFFIDINDIGDIGDINNYSKIKD